LVIVTPDGKISAPIQGVPAVDARGQGGLLDVSLDPNFATNRWVYLSFSEPRAGGKNGTSVGRAKLSADETSLEDWKVIFAQTPAWDSDKHFGSRLAWDKTGLLYITLGERFTAESRQLSQDLKATIGKVVRIKSDGTVPADNPFVGNANALPEIWSYGHRNPQGAAIHPVTGELWTLEHGPKGGDEVNKPEAGKNYGWPIITYGEDYSGAPIGAGIASKAGMEQPIYYFDPVIAPGGINFYQGTLFTGWENNLLIGSLTPGGLVRLVFKDNKVVGEERVVKELGRVRDLDVAADGSIWVISDSGQLNRLTPKP
ncbi:MAG: PQQ-dependent sugar dehydrogenase, partial [Moraxellaceae bacterium]